jgi:hypothetical protein
MFLPTPRVGSLYQRLATLVEPLRIGIIGAGYLASWGQPRKDRQADDVPRRKKTDVEVAIRTEARAEGRRPLKLGGDKARVGDLLILREAEAHDTDAPKRKGRRDCP